MENALDYFALVVCHPIQKIKLYARRCALSCILATLTGE